MALQPGGIGGITKTAVERGKSVVEKSGPETWVDEHGDVLYRYALERVRKPEVAQDLVQDTFLAAVRSYDRFAGQSSVRSWLCGILKHKICDYYRKRGRETSFTDLEFLADECSQKFVPEGYWIHMNGPKEWKPEADEVDAPHRVLANDARLPEQIARTNRDRVHDARNGRDREQGNLRNPCDQREQLVGNATSRAHGFARMSRQ